MSIALVSAPWALFSRPSVQLGALKAYLRLNSDQEVTCHHPYLQVAQEIGIGNYGRIAESGWAGEAVFASLLFPKMSGRAKDVFVGSLGGDRRRVPDFAMIRQQVEEACSRWIDSVVWGEQLAAGFSVCFYQLHASLYLAAELKKKTGCPPIVFGGSSCCGELGLSLLNRFEQLDYVVDGEGETPLVALCAYLDNGGRGLFPDRVFSRDKPPPEQSIPSPAVADLNALPVPDYSDYFVQVGRIFPDQPFIPALPLEFSRGCWWNKCTFCNLNLQWQGYRWKGGERMFEEIKRLTAAHQSLDFFFTDNALPPKEASVLFSRLASHPADYRFFAEIRGQTNKEELMNYSRSGLKTIQVGIESFSSSLLDKMKKGVSAIENIAIMKFSQSCGIVLEGNLIIEFPGSTEQEVEQTLEALDYVLPFRPLSSAAFFLGFGSPVYNCPKDYGIHGLHHHKTNSALLPGYCLEELVLISMGYRGDRVRQKKLWRPVKQKVLEWKRFHQKRRDSSLPALSYRDGIDFLLIRQERSDSAPLRHRLRGVSRALYLFCDEIRQIEDIHRAFPRIKEQAVSSFIEELCIKRLMFREGNRVISLAVPEGGCLRFPSKEKSS